MKNNLKNISFKKYKSYTKNSPYSKSMETWNIQKKPLTK